MSEEQAVIKALNAMIAARDAEIERLQVQLDAVPVNCIRRYHTFTHYDAGAEYVYSTQQFDSDDMQIGMWLESLEDDA